MSSNYVQKYHSLSVQRSEITFEEVPNGGFRAKAVCDEKEFLSAPQLSKKKAKEDLCRHVIETLAIKSEPAPETSAQKLTNLCDSIKHIVPKLNAVQSAEGWIGRAKLIDSDVQTEKNYKTKEEAKEAIAEKCAELLNARYVRRSNVQTNESTVKMLLGEFSANFLYHNGVEPKNNVELQAICSAQGFAPPEFQYSRTENGAFYCKGSLRGQLFSNPKPCMTKNEALDLVAKTMLDYVSLVLRRQKEDESDISTSSDEEEAIEQGKINSEAKTELDMTRSGDTFSQFTDFIRPQPLPETIHEIKATISELVKDREANVELIGSFGKETYFRWSNQVDFVVISKQKPGQDLDTLTLTLTMQTKLKKRFPLQSLQKRATSYSLGYANSCSFLYKSFDVTVSFILLPPSFNDDINHESLIDFVKKSFQQYWQNPFYNPIDELLLDYWFPLFAYLHCQWISQQPNCCKDAIRLLKLWAFSHSCQRGNSNFYLIEHIAILAYLQNPSPTPFKVLRESFHLLSKHETLSFHSWPNSPFKYKFTPDSSTIMDPVNPSFIISDPMIVSWKELSHYARETSKLFTELKLEQNCKVFRDCFSPSSRRKILIKPLLWKTQIMTTTTTPFTLETKTSSPHFQFLSRIRFFDSICAQTYLVAFLAQSKINQLVDQDTAIARLYQVQACDPLIRALFYEKKKTFSAFVDRSVRLCIPMHSHSIHISFDAAPHL